LFIQYDYYVALRYLKIINIVNDKMNKTSISSVVCFDIIDFAKKSEAERQVVKKQLTALLDLAVVDIPEKDRMIVDTGHGAIVTCSGSLENALEDALFIALTVRDEVLNNNAKSETPLYLLIGINLGSVKVAKSTNVNDAPNIVGEGLIEAQRIMSFANPNQILVSRTYYDMASKLTLEIAQMFEKYDMHAYEHDIYAVRLLNEKAIINESSAVIPGKVEVEEDLSSALAFNWSRYLLPLLLAIAILFAFTRWLQAPVDAPTITMPPSVEENAPLTEDKAAIDDNAVEDKDASLENAQAIEVITQEQPKQEQQKQTNAATKVPVTKKAPQKPVTATTTTIETESAKSSSAESTVTEGSPAPAKPAKTSNQGSEKSGWQSFKESIKQGAERECTQAEKALNQCN
jgi:class 3 adenylate cyclase